MTAVVTVVFTSCPTRGGQQRNQFIFEDAIMKGWLQLNILPPSVGLKPGTARSTGQR